MWTPITSGNDRKTREDRERANHAPPELHQLELRDPPARDDAVGARQIFVDEEWEGWESLRDADPCGALLPGGAA